MATLDAKGNEIINGYSTNLTPTQNASALPVSTLTKSPQIKLPVVTDTTNYGGIGTSAFSDINTNFANTQATQIAATEASNKANQGGIDFASILAGKEATNAKDVAGTYSANGVNTAFNTLQDLQAQATGLQNEAQAIPIQIQNESAGQGRTDRGVAPIESARLRDNALKSLSLGQQYAIASGNYNKAKNYADQLIETKYAGELAVINALKTQQTAYEKYVSNPAQQARLDAVKAETDAKEKALNYKIEQEKQAEAQKLADKKAMEALVLKIAPQNPPKKVVDILNDPEASFNDKVIASAPYLTSAIDRAELSYKMAQTAKVYADMRNDAMTVGSNVAPENMLPFSQEYAVTGKIPVGAPKGSQASIMRYAKELPQPTGALVSSITGVASNGVGAVEQKDLASLYNITQNIAELKKLDEKRVGGLVAGTFGKVFGSEAQSAYLAKRKAIVDDISRMQSGAALTQAEVSFYEDYLPGRLSETAGLGQDSKKKIENFENIMNDKLKRKLVNNQLSIYGYSTIKASNGVEYKVGDLIQANGVTGRVNPDGTITIVQ